MSGLFGVFLLKVGCRMADPVEPKNPLTSKLNLLGALQLVVSVCALLGGSELIQQYPKAVAVVAGISGVVTIVLRFMTSVPISW